MNRGPITRPNGRFRNFLEIELSRTEQEVTVLIAFAAFIVMVSILEVK